MNCPSCGAPVEILPGMINYVCPYCNNILLFEHNELKETGKKSSITPFPSKLEYGKQYYVISSNDSNSKLLKYNIDILSEKEYSESGNKKYLVKFYIYSQIRYLGDAFFFDKFFIRVLDDKTKNLNTNKDMFIEADEGQFKFFYLDIVNKDGTFDKFFQSDELYVDNFFIQEKGIQKIEGFKGAFPFNIPNKNKTKYLNLVGDNLKKYLLEDLGDKILYGEGI